MNNYVKNSIVQTSRIFLGKTKRNFEFRKEDIRRRLGPELFLILTLL